MHINYQYLLHFIRNNSFGQKTRSLDFGCGAATVVSAARHEGLDVYGTDVFYAANKNRQIVEQKGLLGTIITEIKNGRTVFPDEHFDVIVNNQVLEHVEDLDQTLKELKRILKRGGTLLSLFPSKEVWWEGHRKLFFLHWFAPGNPLRVYYAYFWRILGKGGFKGDKTPMEWARYSCQWIDKFTFYRPQKEIISLFAQYFNELSYLENDYLLFRLKHEHPNLYPSIKRLMELPPFDKFFQTIVRKRAGMVFAARKPT